MDAFNICVRFGAEQEVAIVFGSAIAWTKNLHNER